MSKFTTSLEELIDPNRYEDWATRLRSVGESRQRMSPDTQKLMTVYIEVSKKPESLLFYLIWLLSQVEPGNALFQELKKPNDTELVEVFKTLETKPSLPIIMEDTEVTHLVTAILDVLSDQTSRSHFWVSLEPSSVLKKGKYVRYEEFSILYVTPDETELNVTIDTPIDIQVFRQEFSGDQIAIGIIDDSIGFANTRFHNANVNFNIEGFGTRIQNLWIQALDDDNAREIKLNKFSIDQSLNAAKNKVTGEVNELKVYQDLGLGIGSSNSGIYGRAWGHGTHVMDLAAGFDQDDITGIDRPIFAVQLPTQVTRNTSGRFLASYALKGLQQIFEWADQFGLVSSLTPEIAFQVNSEIEASGGVVDEQPPTTPDLKLRTKREKSPLIPLVVNFSYGYQAGPKDGSSSIEKIIDIMVQDRVKNNGPTRVILPAGNSFNERTTANMKLKPNQTESVGWIIQPDDRTESYIEIWLPEIKDDTRPPVEVKLIPPKDLMAEPLVSVLDNVSILTNDGLPVAGLYFDFGNENQSGMDRPRLLLCINRTNTRDNHSTSLKAAPTGEWTVEVKNTSDIDLKINLHIQRDDTLSGENPNGRQSFFDHRNAYEKSLKTGAYEALKRDDCPITGEGSLSALTGGEHVKVIGAASTGRLQSADGNISANHFSTVEFEPSNYTAEGIKIERDEGNNPDASAVVDHGSSFQGIYASGIMSGSMELMTGTSVAAPIITRELANHNLNWDSLQAAKASNTHLIERLGSFISKRERSSKLITINEIANLKRYRN